MISFKLFFSKILNKNFSLTTLKNFFLKKLGWWEPVVQRRIDLSDSLFEAMNGTIGYGALKGMHLPNNTWWGQPDRASMLLGSHELEVLEELENSEFDLLVDIGAADGYYAIGCLVAGIAKRSVAFEISEIGQNVIRKSAEMNGVAERIEILGEFKSDNKFLFDEKNLINTLIIMDIEGAEYMILNRDFLKKTKKCKIIVELHPFFTSCSDPTRKLLDLIQFLERPYRFIEQGARNPFKYVELAHLNEDDKWLCLSEGRTLAQKWLVIESS